MSTEPDQSTKNLTEAEIAALREFFERRAAAPMLTSEEFDKRIDAMIERKRRERGLKV